jgi:hypothetical protein
LGKKQSKNSKEKKRQIIKDQIGKKCKSQKKKKEKQILGYMPSGLPLIFIEKK